MKVAFLLNSSSGYSLCLDDEYPVCFGDSVFLEAGIMVEIIKQACGRSLVKGEHLKDVKTVKKRVAH
jgi:hypothetical protein